MLKKELLHHIHKYVHPFRITNGQIDAMKKQELITARKALAHET